MNDIQALCKRVFVINKGKSLYDGDFEKLVNHINPKRKLIFEFSSLPSQDKIKKLGRKYDFEIKNIILNAELSDLELIQLVSYLYILIRGECIK